MVLTAWSASSCLATFVIGANTRLQPDPMQEPMISNPSVPTLHDEILDVVCEELSFAGVQYIKAFSLVSKRFSSIACRHLFRHITIRLRDEEQLLRDIDALSKKAFLYIKGFRIVGQIYARNKRTERFETRRPPSFHNNYFHPLAYRPHSVRAQPP